MAKTQLLVSPAALNDLKAIYRYGLEHWGQAQSARYLDTLRAQFWTLTAQPYLGVERAELFPDLRSLVVGRHVLFYRVCSNQVEMVRVLHARQDPLRHLE